MSVQAMSWVIEQSRHKGSAFVVLLMIANHAHSDGTGSCAGFETLAREARISARHVIRIIKKLEKSGELSIERGASRYGTNLYRIHMRQGAKFTDDKMSQPKSACDNLTRENRVPQMSPEPLLTKTFKTPLPPASGGEQVFEWCRETVAVNLGRRKRLPDLKAYQGARAGDVVQFLRGRGFDARVLECVQ